MSGHVISGIQQLGVGVPDVEVGFEWYRKSFGFDLPVFREAAEAPLMTRYTGNAVQSRDAMLATNFGGGGGFEIWQYTSRTPAPPESEIQLGDLGIFGGRLRTQAINEAYRRTQEAGVDVVGGITTDPAGAQSFYVKDLYGNFFQIVESAEWFRNTGHPVGGVEGAIIGVSDVEKALPFYQRVLGLDRIVYDSTDTFPEFDALPGGHRKLRRTLVTHSKPHQGPFSRMFGSTSIELMSTTGRKPARIFENRYWGDLGFIHLCFDVVGMDELNQECEAAGHSFTVDSGETFDMGEAGGRFAYVEDPDGTLIEFVETHRIPIMKKWNWYLDLRKRNRTKPLPGFFFTLMGLTRVKK